ncbi:C6 transcription factor [Colletotrichum incanum]|nr:C6 transcription factor [Colletotrichum incanum]
MLIVNSYVESLKRRVADLEHNVQSSSRKRARTESYRAESTNEPSPADVANSGSQDAVSVASTHASVRNTRRGNEDSSVRATMGAIGFLSRSAMAEPRGQSDDLPRKFSLGEIVSGALAIDGRDPSKASPAPQTHTIDGHFLPLTRDATSGYFRRFLDYAVSLPYIDEESLLDQYDSIITDNGRPQDDTRTNPLHVFNVHMALAIGIMMSPDSAHLSMLSSGFHAVASKQLHSILRSEISLEHVHCMVMLLLYSLWNSAGGSAWHLLGLTVKTCISLGLHREPDAHADLTISEADRRKWMFWSVYSLDR